MYYYYIRVVISTVQSTLEISGYSDGKATGVSEVISIAAEPVRY